MTVQRVWTPDRVKEELVTAFSHRPDTGIYSPSKANLVHAITGERLVE